MNNIEKVKRQLSKRIPITIGEEGSSDEFMFKPLNIEQQAIMMEISKKIQSRPMIEIEGVEVPDLAKEDMIDMGDLIKDVVMSSIPELTEEDAKDFTSDNFNQLSEALADLMPKTQGNTDLMKKKLEEARNGRK